MTSFFRRRKKDGNATASSRRAQEGHEDAEPTAVEERSGLFLLHECPSHNSRAVDVVAVHGLGGHWSDTWTGVSQKNWLKDFLPVQLQDAGIAIRVLSYGYDSDTAFSKAVTDIDDVAAMLLDRLVGERQSAEEKSRAVIFIAHSLGGIVVKKAMIIAHERSTYYGDLLRHVRGVVFLGVPHRGSDVAYWASFAANILQFGQLGLGTNPAYVRALQTKSPTFANISTQFIERAAPLSIRTFFETERMGGKLIVDKDSAVLRLPNEIAVGVAQSNHKMMCKFDNKDSQKYRPVWQAIKGLAESIVAKEVNSTLQVAQSAESRKAVFSVPFPRDNQFVDRKSIFSQINAGFREDCPVALCGIGGVGKSQIAIEYAYRFREQHAFGHVLWIYAGSETRFTQAYREIASQLQLPGYDDPKVDVCRLVCDWLNSAENVPWLMILDNADRAANFLPQENEAVVERSVVSTSMVGYLPTKFNDSQFLLITTRNRDIGEYLSHGQPCIDVGPFSSEEAGDLFRAKVRGLEHSGMPEVNALVETLGRIPLAVTQAAAFINRNKISVQQYVDELAIDKQSFMDYLSKDLQDPRREPGFPNSVFRTWKLSFDQIRIDAPRAAEILSLMAMLDGQKISEDLIREEDERRIDFRIAIGTLDGYSMINKEIGVETCAIHPLVQLSIQYVLQQSGEIAFYAERALQQVAERFPVGEHENKAMCESLLPHAQAVLGYDAKSKTTMGFHGDLLYKVGWFEWRQGRYDLAHQNVHAAYQIDQEMLGAEAEDTLNSLTLLALVLHYQGKYEVAEEMNRRALAGREKVLGPEHPYTLTSVVNLATVLRYQGKYEAAEEMNRRALAGYEKVLGLEHPDTLASVGNLASVLQDQGKYEAAEEMNRRALAGREKVLGLEHPYTLTSVNNLALVLQDQGKYEVAEEMNRRALAGYEKVLGPEHPDTLTSVNNQALVLQYLGKYEAAEEMNRRALAGYEKVLGLEHPATLTSVNNLALVLQYQGKYEAAEEMNRRALAGREKVLGLEHPDTLTSVYSLAYLLRSRQQFEQASALYQRALSGFQKTLGLDHPIPTACGENYSALLQEMEMKDVSQ